MAVEEEETGSARGSFDKFGRDAEIAAKIEELRSGAETLRAEFEEETVAALRADHAAGAGCGFDDLGVEAGFAESVGAGQAGDSGADD